MPGQRAMWGVSCLTLVLICSVNGLTVPSIDVDEVAYGSELNQLLGFGANNQGQLGLGHRIHVTEPTSPRLASLLASGDCINKVFTGCNSGHVILLSSHGVIVGWGSNEHGQLGLTPSHAVVPRIIGADIIGPVSQVAIGSTHTLILTRKNELYRLISGKIEEISHPHLHILAIAAGNDFSLVSVEDGRAFTVANDDDSFQGFRVRGFAATVAACADQGYIVTTEGSIWAWGNNQYGQLLGGTTLASASREYPFQSSAETAFGTILSLRPGLRVTLALTDDGSLLAYSRKSSGPEKVKLGTDYTKIMSFSVGTNHALVTLANGDVYSWGSNDNDQLGIFDGDSQTNPQRVYFTAQADRKYAYGAAGEEFSILIAACPDVRCVHGIASPSDGCACVCDAGWSGDDCSLCERAPDFCNFHGTLMEHECRCDCELPWLGEQCGECGLECEHGSTEVINGTCSCGCEDLWGGHLCDVCLIQSTQCFQGHLDSRSCSCQCREPWLGDYCNVCGLSPHDCLNGELDTQRCTCACRGEWTGEQCDVCGIGESQDLVCQNVTMWNSNGQGWQGHVLHITDPSGTPVAQMTLHGNNYGKEEVCLVPGVYSVFACGPPHTNSLFNGWSLLDAHGSTSDTCEHKHQTIVVSGGGCNMGAINSETCSCDCDGAWHGAHDCIPFDVRMTESFYDAWIGNKLVFQDSTGRWTKTLEGIRGDRQVCLPEGEFGVFACRTASTAGKLSPDATISWRISLGHYEIQGSHSAETYCDLAQMDAVFMNVTQALQPYVSPHVDEALANLGVNSVRSQIFDKRVVSGFCDRCDLIDKCVHGEFQSSCMCKCDAPWTGAVCDRCGLTLDAYPRGRARLDAKHCEVHCIGGWTGKQCTTCGLIDTHCDGVVNHATCTCQPVDEVQSGGSLEADSLGSAPPAPVRQCHHPWTGPDCSVCPRQEGFCHHNGTLENCICDCHIPWMGEDCSACAIQDQSCHQGKRNPNLCACDCAGGWTGLFCEECKADCQNGYVNDDCECTCSHGWVGVHCEACSVADGDCVHGTKNDATCQCECEPGWGGEHCDECFLKGCVHGAVDLNACQCMCDAPWIGNRCDACGRTSNDCVHGSVNISCQCDCEENWKGELCDVCPLGEHSCSHGFFESELCKCTCPEHRSGVYCEHCDLTPDVCGGSVNKDHCVCNMQNVASTPSAVPTPSPSPVVFASKSASPSPTSSEALNMDNYQNLLNFASMPISSFNPLLDGNVAPVVQEYSIQLLGGSWKAFALPAEYTITAATHLEFDMKVNFVCESVSLTLARPPFDVPSTRLIQLVGTTAVVDSNIVDVSDQVPPPAAGEDWQHYNILLSGVFRPGDVVTHLVIANPCESDISDVEFRRVDLYEGSSRVFRRDLRCGSNILAPYAGPAQCSALEPALPGIAITPCCSVAGQCGSSSAFCDCDGCVDYRPGMGFVPQFVFTTHGIPPEVSPSAVPEPSRLPSYVPAPSPPPTPVNVPMYIEPSSLSEEDYAENRFQGEITKDRYSLSIEGGTKKALKLSSPFHVTQATHLVFDVRVSQVCLRHGVALIPSIQHSRPSPGTVYFQVAGSLEVATYESNRVQLDVHTDVDGSVPWQTVEIPAGLFLRQGNFQYIAFFADCVSGEDSETQFANIKLSETSSSVDANGFLIPFGEDHGVAVVNGTKSIHLHGPSSRITPLLSPHVMTSKTELHFDFRGNASCASQMIGLSTSVSSSIGQRAFRLNGFMSTSALDIDYSLVESYQEGWKHYRIPIGRTYAVGTTFPYVYLVSACQGSSYFANIQVLEKGGDLSFSMLPMHTYDSEKDTRPSVVADGNQVTLSETSWKAFDLLRPVQIHKSTHLEFDLTISHVCDVHGIAFVQSLDASSAGKHIKLAGTRSDLDLTWISAVEQYSVGWKHFSIPVGLLYKAGSYPYLALVQECQCGQQKCKGESTFANVRVYNVNEA